MELENLVLDTKNKIVVGYDYFNKETTFIIIWEKFFIDFAQTLAIGIDVNRQNELCILSVNNYMGKDIYSTINTYFLETFTTKELKEKIIKEFSYYVKNTAKSRMTYDKNRWEKFYKNLLKSA